jgi:uncharacterized membrane protein YidH (DUF202 family)
VLRKLLICGLVAGLCGGLLATGFASVAGEPAVDAGIAYQDAQEDPGAAVPAPVSRDVQKSVGLLAGAAVYGVALGGIFALVFALAYGRAGRAGPRATAYVLAAAGFTVVFLVPFLKYPATPPGAADAATIGHRTALYATMIAISVLAAIGAARLRSRLERRLDSHAATLATGAAFVIVVVAAGVTLPSVQEVPADYPATTLWRFREAAVGTQVVLWSTMGLLFAAAAQRVMHGEPVLRRGAARAGLPAGASD